MEYDKGKSERIIIMGVTTKDIAKICNVSRTTVNRAFSNTGRISEETKQLILKTAEELNYRPDILATGLKNGRTGTIGVLVFDVKNQYFAQMLNAIELSAQKKNYFANISLHEKNKQQESEMLQRMVDYRVEGIILSPVSKDKKFEKTIRDLEKPVVIVGNKVSEKIPFVGIDEFQAAKDAVGLIASKGYKRIVFVCPPLADKTRENIYSHEQRNAGFEAAVDELEVEGISIGSWDYLETVKECIKKSKEKTAVFCSGDIYALEIMKELRKDNLKPKEDYGIMGFDNIGFLDYVMPRMATIDNSVEAVAESAVETLFKMINGEDVDKEIIVPYRIVEGETL